MGVVWVEFVSTSMIDFWLPHQRDMDVEGIEAAMAERAWGEHWKRLGTRHNECRVVP